MRGRTLTNYMTEEERRLLFAAVFLWAAAIPDLRDKRIPLWIPCVFAIPAVLGVAVFPTVSGRLVLLSGIIPGVIFVFLALVLHGKIGTGDGICMSVCGLIVGVVEISEILFLASVAAGAAGIWFLVVRKCSGESRIPFLPFLAGGGTVEFIIRMIMR